MLVEFSCSECGAVLEADGEMGGGISPCPNCGTLLLVPAPAIRPGTTIGGFYIERKLGAGAMGEVYLATQLTIEREVALKVLPPALVQDPGSLERFLREVRLAGSLEHPNIVAVHAAGEDQGVYYLAMSFVRGVSLQDHLDKDGPLPEKRALEITRKIADALAYAWNRHRLVHRDVKPANIMIDEDGEPKLLDLGLAKRTAVDIGMTAAGLVVGTPSFMSPEQADPAREVDFRSDMYSLGATLYTLVTGKRPFPGKTAQEVLRKVIRGLRVEPKTVNSAVSDSCNELIVKMMARKPSQRFTSWEACIAAVDDALNPGKAHPKPRPGGLALRRPVTPPPVQPVQGRPQQTRTRPGGRGLTTLILLAAAAGAGWWLYRGHRQPGRPAGARVVGLPGQPRPAARSRKSPPSKTAAGTTKKPAGPAGGKPAPPPTPVFKPASPALLKKLTAQAEARAAREFAAPARRKALADKLGIELPVGKPLVTPEQAERAVRRLLDREVARKYPASLEADIRKKAEEKFQLQRLGQSVTVRLNAPRGGIDHFTGIYLGIRNGKAVIGPQRVPLPEIVEEDRARLQPGLAQEKKSEFIRREMDRLEKQRRQFAAELEPRIRRQVMGPAGYVKVGSKWLAAPDALANALAAARKKRAAELRPIVFRQAGLVRRHGKWGRLVAPKPVKPPPKRGVKAPAKPTAKTAGKPPVESVTKRRDGH